jgi:outer membrane immunogenic protein
MKKFLIAATALSGLLAFAGSAAAADLAVPVDPVYDWSGFYIGAHGGYGWGDSDNDASNGASWSADIEGIVAGIHAGYNLQMDSFVFGIEADVDFSDIDGHTPCPNAAFECDTDVEWFGSLRARAGFAMDNLLIYGTGGVALAEAEFGNTLAGVRIDESDDSVGFVVGGGAEFAAWENISLRAEVLYYNFDDFGFAWSNDGGISYDSELDFIVARAGVTFHF